MGKSKSVSLSAITVAAVLIGLGLGVASPATAAGETVTADLSVTPTVLSLDPGGQGVQKFEVTNLGPGTLGPSFRVAFSIALPEYVSHISSDPLFGPAVYFRNNATGLTEQIDCWPVEGLNVVQCPAYSPFAAAAAPGWSGTLSILLQLASDAPADSERVDGAAKVVESAQSGATWIDGNLSNNSRVFFDVLTPEASGTPAVASLPTAASAGILVVAFCAAVFRYRRRVRPQIAGRSAA